MLIAHSHL